MELRCACSVFRLRSRKASGGMVDEAGACHGGVGSAPAMVLDFRFSMAPPATAPEKYSCRRRRGRARPCSALSNQREISWTRVPVAGGAKVPIRTRRWQRLRPVAREARMYPVPSEVMLIMIGLLLVRRPITADAEADHAEGEGDGGAVVWCVETRPGLGGAGATTTDHMPTPPMADSRTRRAPGGTRRRGS